MFGKLGAPEILLILVVLVLLFGAKRLPGMARSLGQSLRILKSETKALRENGDGGDTTAAGTPAASAGPASAEASAHTVTDMPGPQEAPSTAPRQDTVRAV